MGEGHEVVHHIQEEQHQNNLVCHYQNTGVQVDKDMEESTKTVP